MKSEIDGGERNGTSSLMSTIKTTSPIPMLLSQTWKSEVLPPEAAILRDGWIKKNPKLDCRIFDDAKSRRVVQDIVPDLIDSYDRLPHPVMRADIFRYAIIYRDGGMYADIDMECIGPIDEFMRAGPCLMAIESHLTHTRMKELEYPAPIQIANCIFAAVPGHPFFLAAIHRALALFQLEKTVGYDRVEDITGPRMLTRLFFEQEWEGMVVAHQIGLMAPLHYPDIWPINRNMFTRHRTYGTWKIPSKNTSLSRLWIERNKLVNPFPSRRFFPAKQVQDGKFE